MSIALQDLSQSVHNVDASQNGDRPPHHVSQPSSSSILTSDAGANEARPADHVITTSLTISTSSATSAPVIDDASSEVQEWAAAQPNGPPSPRKRWYGFGSSMTKIIVFLVTVAAFGVTIYYSEYVKREQDEGNILSRQGNEKAAESLEQGDISLALDLWGYCVDRHIEEIQECQNQDHRVMEYLKDEAQVSRRSTHVIVSSGRQLWNTTGDYFRYALDTYRKASRILFRMVRRCGRNFMKTVTDYTRHLFEESMRLSIRLLHAAEIFTRRLRAFTADYAQSLPELNRSIHQTSLQTIASSRNRLWQLTQAFAHHLLGVPMQFGQTLSEVFPLFHPANAHWFTNIIVMIWTFSAALDQPLGQYSFLDPFSLRSPSSKFKLAAYTVIAGLHLLAIFSPEILASRASGGYAYLASWILCSLFLIGSVSPMIISIPVDRTKRNPTLVGLVIERVIFILTSIAMSVDKVFNTGLSMKSGVGIIINVAILLAPPLFGPNRVDDVAAGVLLVLAVLYFYIHLLTLDTAGGVEGIARESGFILRILIVIGMFLRDSFAVLQIIT